MRIESLSFRGTNVVFAEITNTSTQGIFAWVIDIWKTTKHTAGPTHASIEASENSL